MVYSNQFAIIIILLGGYMFLPEKTAIDLPMLPPFNKESASILAILIGCSFVAKHKITLLGKGKVKWLILIYLMSPFLTAMNNGEVIVIHGTVLPAMNYYDALTELIGHTITLVPFIIGRQFFKKTESQLLFFKVMAVGGLLYSLLVLIEIRMSPQLHTWVYGFFPHQFIQMKRMGGWRPVVFMSHGLTLAIFMAAAFVSSYVFVQKKKRIAGFLALHVACYLFVILILCKSYAPLFYVLMILLVLKLCSIKMQFKFAKIVAIFVLLYPLLSILDWFPHKSMVNLAEEISLERAQSLEYRFTNEYILLNHAKQKVFFGWGTWSRNRVFSKETGEDLSTTDGDWIITLGTYGIIGFAAKFLLFIYPVFRAVSVYRFVQTKEEKNLLAIHSLLISFILLDQIPNSSLSIWVWLFAGILLGRTETISREVSLMRR
mgnify:CR=1 FL=1